VSLEVLTAIEIHIAVF